MFLSINSDLWIRKSDPQELTAATVALEQVHVVTIPNHLHSHVNTLPGTSVKVAVYGRRSRQAM